MRDPTEAFKGAICYVETLNILMLCRRMGIEQWESVFLSCDNQNRILEDWPGPVTRYIWGQDLLSEVAKQNLKQWYKASTNKSFELAR